MHGEVTKLLSPLLIVRKAAGILFLCWGELADFDGRRSSSELRPKNNRSITA